MNFYLNLKYKSSILSLITLVFCILYAGKINAQTAIPDSLQKRSVDTTYITEKKVVDSLNSAGDSPYKYAITNDSTQKKVDTLKTSDTLSLPAKKDIETTILYNCRDSIRMNMAEQKVYLYGDAKVVYGSKTLTAEYMEINWALNEVKAYGKIDTTSGRFIGNPVFHEGAEMYTAEIIRYNMKSGKGYIKGIVTKQGDGYIQGGPVKRMPEAVYIKNAIYTTCNLPHPHFSINASKLKVIPNDKIVSGPFHMQIMHIPIPIGFPLGFFPASKRSKSGFIIPSPGQQTTRGFFLTQGGYYWAVNNHVGIKVLMDIYSNGTFNPSVSSSYLTRYEYSGQIAFHYSRLKTGFDNSQPIQSNYNFTWQHSSLSNKSGKFSANVNISSSSYYSKLSYNTTTNTQGVFNSTITYRKVFQNTPFALSIFLSQNQNTTTKVMNVTAPNVALSMNRIFPFKSNRGGKTKWYETIGLSYTGTSQYLLSNQINRNNSTVDQIVITPNASNYNLILSNGQWGAMHSIPISSTFKLFNYFNINPGITYNQWWYLKKLDYEAVYNTQTASTTAIIKDTIHQFNIAQSINFSVALTTRIYGTYKIKTKILKAIRHTINPSITYNFIPDVSANNNYFQKFPGQIMSSDNKPTPYSRHANFTNAGPSPGLTNQLSFSINNILEGKVRNRKDTTGETALKKVKLLDNLSLAGAYNFGADSLKLSMIQIGANSRFFNKIDFRFSGTLDPYEYILDSVTRYGTVIQRRVNRFVIDEHNGTKKIANLSNYNLSLSTSLNPEAFKSQNSLPTPPVPTNPNGPLNNNLSYPSPYVDFNLPWNVSLGYVLSYQKTGFAPTYYSQSLSVNGEVKLSDNWKVKFITGYDFVHSSITNTTSLQIFRDLHCWQMNISIIPYGLQQSFIFTLNAKSALLKDAKINKRSSSVNNGGYGY